jgi:hypothetical protein
MASLNHKRETEENTGRRRIEYRNKEEIRRKKEESHRRMLTSCVSESHTLCHKWVSRNPPKPLTH